MFLHYEINVSFIAKKKPKLKVDHERSTFHCRPLGRNFKITHGYQLNNEVQLYVSYDDCRSKITACLRAISVISPANIDSDVVKCLMEIAEN